MRAALSIRSLSIDADMPHLLHAIRCRAGCAISTMIHSLHWTSIDSIFRRIDVCPFITYFLLRRNSRTLTWLVAVAKMNNPISEQKYTVLMYSMQGTFYQASSPNKIKSNINSNLQVQYKITRLIKFY